MRTNLYGVVFPWSARRHENPDRLRRALERIADHHTRRLGARRGPLRLVVLPPAPCDCDRPNCTVRSGTVGAKWTML